jgi:hypothetical protein
MIKHLQQLAILAITAMISVGLPAQDAECPCFSLPEVVSLLQQAEALAGEGGTIRCLTQDYSVELKGEFTINDSNYSTIAQVRVEWLDYDPCSCRFLDQTVDPPVDRQARWPHPAPEDLARACFGIIGSAIKQADTSGRCSTHP